MNRQAVRGVLAGTGLIFEGSEVGARTYLGTCFCFLEPTVFVTAAHCVANCNTANLWINHHGGPPPNLFTRVQSIVSADQADVAALITDAPGRKWARPFLRARYVADLGEGVGAVGFPADMLSDTPDRETLRFFRGTVQRPLLYQGWRTPYKAYELSFACPQGLSGAPVFPMDDPSTVLGVMTANFESFTTDHEVVQTNGSFGPTRVESRRIITYGVCANLFGGLNALEAALGYSVPPPEPERVP